MRALARRFVQNTRMTAKIYAVANQKGGVGKTTLAMNLAAGLQRRGPSVVVDADPQASATVWARLAAGPRRFPVPVVGVAQGLQGELTALRANYEFVIVDCPPSSDSGNVIVAMEHAEVVLMPVLPSPMDLWASTRIEEMIQQVRRRNSALRAYLVLNQIESRNAMSRDLEEVLRDFSVPALRHGLNRRASYRTAALEGCSVYDLGARGRPAANEVDAIIEEVLTS